MFHLSVVESIKLSDFFGQFRPTHVLGTTYTVSPVFFEANLWHHISKEELRGCVILCDRKGFERAMQEAGALRAATRSYSLVTAPVPAAFHPKVWLMLADDRLALLCGSGNLTQSGFIDNLELFESITLEKGGHGRGFIEGVLEFVRGLRQYWTDQDENTLPAARLLREMEGRIAVLAATLHAHDGDSTRFLSTFGGRFGDQLADLGAVRRLWVAAPYFGGSLSGIRDLRERLNPAETILCPAYHGDAQVDLPPDEVAQMSATRVGFLELNHQKKKAFAHFKLYGLELSDGRCFSFTGSVNATFNALTGVNVEAGILRELPEETFRELFKESSANVTLTQARLNYESDEWKWLGFWAVSSYDGIEIVAPEIYRRHLPLHSVHLSLKTGVGQFFASRKELFTQSSRARIRWEEFEGLTSRPVGILIVRLQGSNGDESKIRGAAMVEDYASLTSTPLQRNAFQGALSLLQGEGLPDSGELAAVFSLLTSALNFEALDETRSSSNSGSGPATPDKSEPERIPVWPPVAENVAATPGVVGSAIGQVAWFQRLLSQFLVHQGEGTSLTAAVNKGVVKPSVELVVTSDLDSEDESERESEANMSALEKICAARWKQASDSICNVENRFRQIVISEREKHAILPVCIGIVLAAISVKKMIFRLLEPTTFTIPTNGQLAARLVAIVLDDRKQDADYVRPKNCLYRDEVFPPLLEDLAGNHGVLIDPQLGGVVLSFLAYCRADPGVSFPIREWLEFRHYVERQGGDLKSWSGEAERYAQVFLINDIEGVTPAQVRHSLEELLQLGIDSAPSFRLLKELWDVATGARPNVSSETKDSFGTALTTFEVRRSMIDDPRQLFISVSPHERSCSNRKCSDRGIKKPYLGKLRSIYPVVCPTCGFVLVPRILFETFFPNGNQD